LKIENKLSDKLFEDNKLNSKNLDSEEVLSIINNLSKFKIKDKAGEFIGSRMGRPEKAKLRKLTGSPNFYFLLEEKEED